MRILRLLLTPRWLFRHLVVIGMCIGFFFLSRWQFHRGEQISGTVQNYGYSVEWLAFGGCVCFGWWKMLQDELHPEGVKRKNRAMVAREPRTSPWRTPTTDTVAELVEAPGAVIDPDDQEVVAYNAYLADLNAGRIRR